jgi:hypothetical protein
VLLQAGRIAAIGPAGEVTEQYLANQLLETKGGDLSEKARNGNGQARFVSLRLVGPDGAPHVTHASGDDLILQMDILAKHGFSDVALAVVLHSVYGARIITSWTKEVNCPVQLLEGIQTWVCRFKNVRLRPGHRVVVKLWMSAGDVLDSVEQALVIEITDGSETQDLSTDAMQGLVVCDYSWSPVKPKISSSQRTLSVIR